MKKPMMVNKHQLGLLQDFTNFPVLQIFMEPHNPSDVAKTLNMPANTMHYRVKKLHEAGLLKIVSQKGRRRSYQSVATYFRVHKDLLNRLGQPSNPTANDALSKLARGYEDSLENYVDKRLTNDSPYIEFGIDPDNEHIMGAFEPCLSLFDMPLSQEQYHKLTKTLIDVLHEFRKEKPRVKTKQCTVAVVAFAKSSAFPTLS